MSDNINDKNINEHIDQIEEEITETEEVVSDDIPVNDTNDEAINEEEQTEKENVEEDAEEIADDVYEEESIDEKLSNKFRNLLYSINRIPTEKRVKVITFFSVIAFITLLILTDIIPILPNAYNRFYVGNSYVIAETQNAVFDKVNGNIVYAASGTIKSFGPNMDCKFSYDAPTGTPLIETNGSNAIVYYENSNDVFLITNGDVIKKINIEEKIKGAYVTSHNYYGIVRDEPGYVSCVEVFKKSGSSLYKWHTNSSIIDIAISESGKYMVASAYEADKNSASTRLIFFDLSIDKPIKEIVLGGNMISEVRFTNSDTVVAFGDIYTQAYSANGTPSWRIDYKGRIPKSYDIGKNSEIAFVFDRYSSSLSESTVELYDKNGNLQGIYDSKDNIKYISCNNGYVLLSLDRRTVLLDNDADVVKIKNTQNDFKKAVLFDNYNFAFSISDGNAEIMSVKH